jgi:glycosyltransferase involved in cell wall biosynthesis
MMVLFLTPGFPENEQDSTCLPAVQRFMISARKLYPDTEFTVLAFQYPFTKKRYKWHGINVVPLAGRNRGGVFRLATWLRAFAYMVSVKKNIKSILSFWITECAFVGECFSRLNRISHYMWIHGQDARPGNRYLSLFKPPATRVIAISYASQREFYRNYDILPATVAENGVLVSQFPEFTSGERDIDILGAGSLIPLKRFGAFVKVVAVLAQKIPGLKSMIAGEGPLQRTLHNEIISLGLHTNLELAGKLSNPQVLDLMNRSKVFLHPSEYEANASVILEALYSGCQVVCRAWSGEIIPKGLHICQSEEEMASCVITLLLDPPEPERVLVSDMDSTAKKIMGLLGTKANAPYSDSPQI